MEQQTSLRQGKTDTLSSIMFFAFVTRGNQKFESTEIALSTQRMPCAGHPVQLVSATTSNRYVPGGHTSALRVQLTAPVVPRVLSPFGQLLHAVDPVSEENVLSGHIVLHVRVHIDDVIVRAQTEDTRKSTTKKETKHS